MMTKESIRMHGAGEGLFFRWCEEYPAVQSECAAHELYRIQSELGSILSWVSIELKGCTWKTMEGVYMESISGRRWVRTIAPRSFGIFWIGGMGDSLIYSRSRYFCGTWSSKHQSLACMIWDLGLGQGYQALFATASSNDTLPKSTTSFGNIHCKSTSRAYVFVQIRDIWGS
jgi:hypothetical protein